MRYFELLNYQHAIGSILVALIFMVLFAVGLAYTPLMNSKNKQPKAEDKHQFADNIEEGGGPFPLIMGLIISGTIIWAFIYVFYYGFSEVNI